MDEFNRSWIIENSKEIIKTYDEGITLRQLYYRLVSLFGMTNDVLHYKRVVQAMVAARWSADVAMESFVDRERQVVGETKAEEKELSSNIAEGKTQIHAWMNAYSLDRWSNQDNFVEVWIEKKALQGVFENPCKEFDVALAPCKGYPSLTFLNEARARFEEANGNGKQVIILYFGDYDPSGEDIPRSLLKNISRMGCDITVKHIALNPEIIAELRLPGVPPKRSDSRTANWDGDSAVELDAVEPRRLEKMCVDAIKENFDEDAFEELQEQEQEEKAAYRKALKEFVNEIEEDD